MTKNKRLDEDSEEEKSEESSEDKEIHVSGFTSAPDMRLLHLYGEVDEKKSNGIVYSMFAYSKMKKYTPKPGKTITPQSLIHEDFDEVIEPLEFLLSTPGGNVSDMFSIYDTMKLLQKNPGMEIHTIGMGKVMSAGTLLMAAGTKGKRKIGRNCRVMIHAINAGTIGSTHDIKNEIEEILHAEKSYIRALAKETKMSVSHLRAIIDEKRNIYLDAKEAVKLGIADIII